MRISENDIQNEVLRVREIAFPLIPSFISNLASLAATLGYSSFLSENRQNLSECILFSLESCSNEVETYFVLRNLTSVPVSLYCVVTGKFFMIRDRYSKTPDIVMMIDTIMANIRHYENESAGRQEDEGP